MPLTNIGRGLKRKSKSNVPRNFLYCILFDFDLPFPLDLLTRSGDGEGGRLGDKRKIIVTPEAKQIFVEARKRIG